MKLINENKNGIYHAYHGTKLDFDEFSAAFLGAGNMEHGWGFYFTDRKDIAQSYGDFIIEADLIINNPLSEDEITITKKQMQKYIKDFIDPTGEDYLSNFGDINSGGYDYILSKAVDLLFHLNNSDTDIFADLFNTSYKQIDLTEALENIEDYFGKDGIISPGYDMYYGKETITYIVFSDRQIINKSKIKSN